MNWIVGVIGFFIAIIIGAFFGKRGSQQDAKILDLTSKIKEKRDEADKKQSIANQKLKDYEKAKKDYDNDPDDSAS